MDEKCGMPIFPKKGFTPLGHCGLNKHHAGKCVLQTEIKSEADQMPTKQLEIDLNDAWKPIRDLPDNELPLYGIQDEI